MQHEYHEADEKQLIWWRYLGNNMAFVRNNPPGQTFLFASQVESKYISAVSQF